MEVLFGNPWAWNLFWLLPLIVILYLLRPKVKNIRIPSLMFIIDLERKRRLRSLFRKLIRDPLLFLQLLILALLITAILEPFYYAREPIDVDRSVVIVLDVSASMQTTDVRPSRFEKSRDAARQILQTLKDTDTVSIVLAENIPVTMLRGSDANTARGILDKINPKATSTGLGNAIMLAKDILAESESEKSIYVISDFSTQTGLDALTAQKQAFAAGVTVNLVGIGEEAQNIAIIDASVERDIEDKDRCNARILVSNFGEKKMAAFVMTLDESIVGSKTLDIEANGEDFFTLDFPCSGSRHVFSVKKQKPDILDVDDEVQLIIPRRERHKVLLIREDEDDSYLSSALEISSVVDFEEVFAPVLPTLDEYDIVILQSITPGNILSGTFEALDDFVEEGGKLIIISSEYLYQETDKLDALFPVDVMGPTEVSGVVTLEREHEITSNIDIESVTVKKHLRVDAKDRTVEIASVSGDEVLAYRESGKGLVMFYGLTPDSEWSNFHLKPSFPIFWLKLIEWIDKDETSSEYLNFRTGEQLALNEEATVVKPSGEAVIASRIFFDETGIYRVEGFTDTFSANLLNRRESQLLGKPESMEDLISEGYSYVQDSVEIERSLYTYVLWAAIILLITEWAYLKRRGTL